MPALISRNKPRAGMVSDAKIAEILNSGAQPEKICCLLIDTANANGGKDNITVIVVEIGDERKLLVKGVDNSKNRHIMEL